MNTDVIHNPKRLEGETFVEYKHRRQLSKRLVAFYKLGKPIKWQLSKKQTLLMQSGVEPIEMMNQVV